MGFADEPSKKGGLQKLPRGLDMTKLYLDVRLDAIPIRGTNFVDLTGRKTFSVGMMTENKSFGITDINIETKTSLQPIVEITFKDLYGNTVFDKANHNGDNNNELDFALLFDWPPPKFRLTFKGYLGKPVTWIMNLKKTSTRYGSSDGSYEIKATFVPNQWGFLADIPFLYLMAKKKLKIDLQNISSSTAITKQTGTDKKPEIDSIFDIIKAGKTVETKTKQASKEFDKLKNQLTTLKTGAVFGLVNKNFAPNEVIDGSVAGRQPIKGVTGVSGQNDLPAFQAITIKMPLSLNIPDSSKFQETLKELQSDSTKYTAENQKIVALIGNPNGVASTMSTLGDTGTDKTIQDSLRKDIIAGNTIIDNNLKLIDVEVKRKTYETSKTELGMITISEVFSRLAADGAFILGSILDAGHTGFENNTAIRSEKSLNNDTSQPLIGRYFPLTIEKGSGEQIPAERAGINDPGCEMDFVKKFIDAISEGIAQNQASQSDDALNSQEGKIESRINNLEIINPNPYKDLNDQQLLETLMIRSGIAAFITRSNDPNKPGDYGNTSSVDNDSIGEIKKLADKEIKNITDSILASLDTVGFNRVKEFCRFVNNMFDVDGEGFSTVATPGGVLRSMIDSPVDTIENIKKWRVIAKTGTGAGTTILGTVEDKFLKVFLSSGNSKSIFYKGTPDITNPTGSINYDTMTAGYLYNNETLWMLPYWQSDKVACYVVFEENAKQAAIDSSSNNDSDSSFNDIKQKETKEPLGVVKITNGYLDESKNKDEYLRIATLNLALTQGLVFDYAKLQNVAKLPLTLINGVYYPDYKIMNLYNELPFKPSNKPYNETNIANGVTYIVYSQVTTDKTDKHLTWGLFRANVGRDVRGRNQRIFLRAICVDLENRMNKIEEEKNNMLSQVLGKASSHVNSLYIQMHHIFHQWGVLGFDMDVTNKNKDGSNRLSENKIAKSGELALKLEEDYANIVEVDSDGNMTKSHNVVSNNPGGTASSLGFRYDFPSEKMMNPKPPIPTVVGHSIINIDSLHKPNANTTLLNIIQQLCTKNNFMFIPIPGNLNYTNIFEIFEPKGMSDVSVGNIFHVLFTPTPENRTKENNGDPLDQHKTPGSLDAFEIEFGSPDNAIIKNLDVGTEDSKPTAESILNLQRLVDKDNSNKVVTHDCSTLSVMEGRSYKMKVEMIGNAQMSPMQYFFVDKMPIFSGLYQVMNVTHSIKANDMTTTIEGIKMRFGNGNIRGIGPITLETLGALTNSANMIEPAVGTTAPNVIAPISMFGTVLTSGVPVSSNDELDLIPGTYLTNNKQPIQLAQINGKPVEVKTAKAYMNMFKAAKQDGITLAISSAFRPQWGPNFSATSTHNVFVVTEGQEIIRRKYLIKSLYPNPDAVPNPAGVLVTTSSDTLKPQGKYFSPVAAAPGQSNHGNGIALDLNTGTNNVKPPLKGNLINANYTWLVKNSWKYGFVRTVATEEWHFDFRPELAKLGPYGGINIKSDAISRDKALFYTELGLSNLTVV